ncbi:hemolysin XhlA family protein [Lactococcus lactis]|uniref:hemolysin XhlA family protein n=1 Tax=Lactococcus lactis TaxID=1358 RepID=UPI00223AE270|nr:hemolysin XhlA family protein [Lactococcus lactis]MCT1174546.1 holin [Lactococcus lactis]
MEEQAWREVLERLARIETKLDNYETVRDKAERALLIAQENAKLIEKMEANNKWAWGFMLTLAVTVIGYLFTKIRF